MMFHCSLAVSILVLGAVCATTKCESGVGKQFVANINTYDSLISKVAGLSDASKRSQLPAAWSALSNQFSVVNSTDLDCVSSLYVPDILANLAKVLATLSLSSSKLKLIARDNPSVVSEYYSMSTVGLNDRALVGPLSRVQVKTTSEERVVSARIRASGRPTALSDMAQILPSKGSDLDEPQRDPMSVSSRPVDHDAPWNSPREEYYVYYYPQYVYPQYTYSTYTPRPAYYTYPPPDSNTYPPPLGNTYPPPSLGSRPAENTYPPPPSSIRPAENTYPPPLENTYPPPLSSSRPADYTYPPPPSADRPAENTYPPPVENTYPPPAKVSYPATSYTSLIYTTATSLDTGTESADPGSTDSADSPSDDGSSDSSSYSFHTASTKRAGVVRRTTDGVGHLVGGTLHVTERVLHLRRNKDTGGDDEPSTASVLSLVKDVQNKYGLS